jgi:hypothetical protein
MKKEALHTHTDMMNVKGTIVITLTATFHKRGPHRLVISYHQLHVMHMTSCGQERHIGHEHHHSHHHAQSPEELRKVRLLLALKRDLTINVMHPHRPS